MAHGDYTHIEIPADDPARAQRFYEGAFGWSFGEYPGFEGYFGYTTPAGRDALGGALGKRGEMAPERIRNYIAVDSVDATVSKVQELGGSIVIPKAEVPGMGWYAAVTDSEGNEIGLWQDTSGGAGAG
ncbi:MAG: VOC family protein [Candidatus Limnocylindrales bacterium]